MSWGPASRSGDFPSLGFGDKIAAAGFFPLPYFNAASVPDSDLRQHQSYRQRWRVSGKLGVICWARRLVGASLDFSLGRATSAAWLRLELGRRMSVWAQGQAQGLGLLRAPLQLSACSQGWPHHDSGRRDCRLCGEWPAVCGEGRSLLLNPNTSVNH